METEQRQSFFRVMKTETEKAEIITHNVLVMLSNRIYIDKAGNKQPLLVLDEAKGKVEDRGDYTYVITANNGIPFAFKIIFQAITSIRKQSVISEFFKDYTQYKKIVIASSFNSKITEYANKNHSQIFKESSLLMNLIEYRDQPRFEILSPSEIKQFEADYNTNKYTTKKYLRSDPIVKYFGLRRGQVVRIIRPSPTTGQAIDYRIVA